MAAIQIPYGGTSITIDVPDFALETTQQDIARESSESNSILSQIASHMGVEVKLSQEQSKAADQLITKIDQQTKETKSLGRQIKDSTRGMLTRGTTGAQNALSGISGKESVTDLLGKDGLLGSVPGLAVAGASIGSLFGILEEFGNTMGALRRVGAGVGMNLQQLRADAAEVGLGLETLSKIVTDNGQTIRSLGKNTIEGTRNFVALNSELQQQTKSLGYFGMAADELAAVLTDEIEIRRRASALNANENMDRVALASSIKENLRLQEAMAAATGTDLADRIKAQTEMRRDSQMAMAQRRFDAGQLAAFQRASGDTTLFGGRGSAGSAMIEDLIKNGLVGGNIGQVDGAAELSGLFSSVNVNLAGSIQQVTDAIQAGDSERVTELMRNLSQSMKDIDSPELNRLSIANNSAALAIQMAADAIGYTAEALEDARRAPTAAEQRDIDLTATRLTMNIAAEQFRVTLMDSILDAFKIPSITDSNFSSFVDSLSNFPSNEGFRSFMDMVTQFNANTSGAAGIVFTISDIGNPSAADKAIAQTNMVNALLEGAGIDLGTIADGARMAAFIKAGMDSGAVDTIVKPAIEGLTDAVADMAEAMDNSAFSEMLRRFLNMPNDDPNSDN